jgi:hypothetical protein
VQSVGGAIFASTFLLCSMHCQATSAIPRSDNPNFHSTSLKIALDWQRAGNRWPASKACSFATLLAATVDGICDAAECNPNFLEATACELVQDAHLLMGGRKWHMDRILKAAAHTSLHRLEKSCAAICDAFTSANKASPAAPDRTHIECVSSIFLTARSAPNADLSWRSVSSCIISWCSTLLLACHSDTVPKGTAESCFLVLSLIADAVRARLCLDFLSDLSCVQLACVCCEFQQEDSRLQHVSIELLDIILSFSAPSDALLGCCAVPVTGCGSKCSLVWQSLCPFSLSLVQPYSSMLVAFFISILQPQSVDGSAPRITIPQAIALNCLRCLNSLLWHDESARDAALSSTESLALALTACSASPQATVRHAAAFVRSTFLLRCSNVDFVDNDGIGSSVCQRHLLHLFPELVRLRSSSRPQSSSLRRPLSASSPSVVASADMIVFYSNELKQKVVHMHGLLHAALSDIFQLPPLMSECGEFVCAILDTATLLCISSDRNRAQLADFGARAECDLWKVLVQAMGSSFSCVRLSALQLAATLRHNSECLAVMGCNSSIISVLRRSVQRLSREEFSNWDTKAAACACSLLHSIVISSPAVASCLLYGRRFGRSQVPVESVDFDAACLQRVYREEDEASDDDALDAIALEAATQIFDVEKEQSDMKFMTIDGHSLPSPTSSVQKGRQSLASSYERTASPSQRKKTLCLGINGMNRQLRFIAGLEQGILSDNFSCRCGSVMLAAELAAVFVSDGLPALAASSTVIFEPNESNVSESTVSQPSTNFTSSSRQFFTLFLSLILFLCLVMCRIAVLLTDMRCIEAAASLLREASPCMHLVRVVGLLLPLITLLIPLQIACKFMSWGIKAGAVLQMY